MLKTIKRAVKFSVWLSERVAKRDKQKFLCSVFPRKNIGHMPTNNISTFTQNMELNWNIQNF